MRVRFGITCTSIVLFPKRKFCRVTNGWLLWVWLFVTQEHFRCGSGSLVGRATGYGLDGTGIESRTGEIFRNCPDRPWGPPSLLYNGYRVFPGGKERPGRDADHSPPSSAVVMKGYSYTSIPPMGRTACTDPQCLYKGALIIIIIIITMRGSNLGGGEIFRKRPDRPWGPPSLLYNGYRVYFPGVKRTGRGVEHPPHPAPRLRKE